MIEEGYVLQHYYILILAIIPLIYKFSFWLYAIQLKEYRWDRFKEYILTPQGKNAILNLWFFVELPLFITSLVIFIDKPFEIILFKVIFYFLCIYNLFVLGKIFRKRILLPKLTGRLLLNTIMIICLIILSLSFMIYNSLNIILYTYILSLLLLTPVIIFFTIILTLPLINYLKNKKINNAIKKSKEYDYPVKIGITGSYGKSSVKEYLSSILEQEGKTLKTPENINTELGISDLILRKLNNTYKYFVAEMGAYRIGEIETLGNIVNHKYGFLTAIGTQHLGLFGSIENTKKGKSEIQNKVLEKGGILYINRENENIKNNQFNENVTIIKYGLNNSCDAYSKITNIKDGFTNFNFFYKDKSYNFSTNLRGEHNIINLSGVLAFCIDREIEYKNLLKYLKNLPTPKNTLEVINKDHNITFINDSYNLSEDGLLAGIDVLNSFEGKKILILDDILELGKESENIHYKIGKKIAEEYKINNILFCGKNYKKSFIKGLTDGGFNTNNIINKIEKNEENTIILFEGKNSNKYIKIINK